MKKLLAGLLGLLLAVFMTVEVAHSHPSSSGEPNASSHCQLCTVAHVAAAAQPASALVRVQHVAGNVVAAQCTPAFSSICRTHYSRPPPALS